MRRYAVVFGIVLSALAVIAIWCWTYLEIYPEPRYKAPSRETLIDDYLAFERWVSAAKLPLTIRERASPAELPEGGVALVQASAFAWPSREESPQEAEALRRWIESGGSLAVFIDQIGPAQENETLVAFLAAAGISFDYSWDDEESDGEAEEGDGPETGAAAPSATDGAADGGAEGQAASDAATAEDSTTAESGSVGNAVAPEGAAGAEGSATAGPTPGTAKSDIPSDPAKEEGDAPPQGPDFDYALELSLAEDATVDRTLVDEDGVLRFATVRMGSGLLTVTGKPYFLESDWVGDEGNARLAWSVSGGRPGAASGILFVRSHITQPALFGRLAERGDLRPLAAAGALLLIVGIWAASSAFGAGGRGEEKPGRPIADRFLAEALFLKKYGALDAYLREYAEELRSILRRRDKENYPDNDLAARRIAELAQVPPEAVLEILEPPRGIGYKAFLRAAENAQLILEKL